MKIIVPIGLLVDTIAEYKDVKLTNNQEVSTFDLMCNIATPSGDFTPINFIIKKDNLQGLELTINGKIIGCASTHIFQQNGLDIYAQSLSVGDYIDTMDGHEVIEKMILIEKCDYYDISVGSPHLYVDANGIIHHNTLITAALSYSCEPYGRTIVIVPNKSLVTQTESDYRNLGLDVGVYFGDRKEIGRTHTICTWQSLNVLLKNTKDAMDSNSLTINEFIEGVVCVMVDECFDGNSKVLTPNGYVPIKDINEGDIVINYSTITEEFKEDVVVEKHVNLTNSMIEKMYELEFNNGVKIQVTGNHKFLTTHGWIRADQLTENHEIIHSN